VSAQDRAAEEQRYFDGYRAFVPLLRADPTVPLLLSYVGDMFWQVDLRDMFFFYYDQAALKESAKGATKMAGRFRLTSRYVDALWSLGHYQAATDRLAENELTTLDTLALLRMNLRFKFVDQANKSGWQQDNLRRLERELELGERILSLARLRSRDLRAELMGQAANDKERAQVEVLAAFVDRNAERLREEVRTELARQGFSALKERPWFLLDYQIVDNPIDLKALIDTP
jgi:hypothetical protein